MKFHERMPKGCPPTAARPFTGEIYRGILKGPDITAQDFWSHREQERRCEANECDCWGLSVWLTEDAVIHARKVQQFVRKWHIARGSVNVTDGVLLATPSVPQPQHHTFWKDCRRDISPAFKVCMTPEKKGSRR